MHMLRCQASSNDPRTAVVRCKTAILAGWLVVMLGGCAGDFKASEGAAGSTAPRPVATGFTGQYFNGAPVYRLAPVQVVARRMDDPEFQAPAPLGHAGLPLSLSDPFASAPGKRVPGVAALTLVRR